MTKMRKNAWRRILTIILSLVMVVTSLPAEAFAAGDDPEEGTEYAAEDGGSDEESEPDEASVPTPKNVKFQFTGEETDSYGNLWVTGEASWDTVSGIDGNSNFIELWPYLMPKGENKEFPVAFEGWTGQATLVPGMYEDKGGRSKLQVKIRVLKKDEKQVVDYYGSDAGMGVQNDGDKIRMEVYVDGMNGSSAKKNVEIVYTEENVKKKKTFTEGGGSGDEDEIAQIPEAITGLVYDGELQMGVPEGTGYTLTGNVMMNAGYYTAKATLAKGYKWSDGSKTAKSIKWSIDPATIVEVTSMDTSFVYDGQVHKPSEASLNVRAENVVCMDAKNDYTVSYSDPKSKEIGNYTLTVTGKGNFTGLASLTYSIVAGTPDLDRAIVVGEVKKEDGSVDENYEYTRKEAERIGLEDKATGTPLVKGKEYTETIIEKTGSNGPELEITYKPIEGKSKGQEITIIKKRSTDKHNVTVHYVDPSGQSVAPTVVKSYEEGTAFSIESPKVVVPGKPGKYYTVSSRYVNGKMEKADLEFSVSYTYEEVTALTEFTVEINYVVEPKDVIDAIIDLAPAPVRMKMTSGKSYSVKSPEVKNYKPDKEVVSGTVRGNNVAVTVTYRPMYTVEIIYSFPNGGSFTVKEKMADGVSYHFDNRDAVKGLTSEQLGRALQDAAGTTYDLSNVWTPDPAEISGKINHADVTYRVSFSCAHPLGGRSFVMDNEEKHHQVCGLCKQAVPRTEKVHTLGEGYYVDKNDLPENLKNDPAYKNGATCFDCKKACGYHKYVSADAEICPASSKDDPQPHLWSIWQKVSDTECARTCARCQLTVTAAHSWGEWGYASSKSHTRRCEHCHYSETASHGNWSNVHVKTPATCISKATASAHCGICNAEVNDVYYGIIATLPNGDQYVEQGHKFDGGYVNIHGGHTQKCSVCGAFDMEHHEEHSFGEGVETRTGVCGNGKIVLTYTCRCGATKREESEWTHNFVRDASREVAASCETPGTECYTCTSCGAHNDKTVEKLGHIMVEDEGNYPAQCDKEGRMWKHCEREGCNHTVKEELKALSPSGHHEFVDKEENTATCVLPGQRITYQECKYCQKKENEQSEWTKKLGHNLKSDSQKITWRSRTTKTGHVIEEEVFFVTFDCTRCGYHAPSQMYTVAKSETLSKYKIETGDVKVTSLADGTKVTGQFGKDNDIYFNKAVYDAYNEKVKTDKELFSQCEGSVITTFTPEYLNSLEDGVYDFIMTNGDELAVAQLTVAGHRITAADDGALTMNDDMEENRIEDGELLFYIGQADAVMTAVNSADDGTPLDTGERNDPSVTQEEVFFDQDENSLNHKDVSVIKLDKGHEYDGLFLNGEAVNVEPDNDRITLPAEYLSTFGEGSYVFELRYKDGTKAEFVLKMNGTGAMEELASEWNLFEAANEHIYKVSGITATTEALNKNKASSKFFDATLSGSTISVRLKDGADRKKAANANIFEFDLGAEGTVSYALPFTYNKPVLKLSVTKGTVRAGQEMALATTVLYQTENGNYMPYDLTGAVVKYGSNAVLAGDDGQLTIKAKGKASDALTVSREGWNESVSLKFTVSEVKADKDLLTIDMGGAKMVTLNTTAAAQSFSFPLYLNGEPATADTVKIEKGKKGEEALGSIEAGMLTVRLGVSGIGKGNYTLKLTGGNAKLSVKVKVSDKAVTAAGKIVQKLDVVTQKPMIITPSLKEISGNVTDATVTAVSAKKGTAIPAEDFETSMQGGSIVVDYVGEEELKASALSIGDMTLSLGYTDDEGKRQTTDLVLKNVSAKKTLPKVKTLKVTIPAAAANDGSAVIGSVNLLSSYKDSAKHTQMIAPAEVTLENKGVEASVDILNLNRIRIKKLDGKSGTIKVTLTYPGGVTKKVTIKVVQGK